MFTGKNHALFLIYFMTLHDRGFSALIEKLLGGVFLAGLGSFLFFGSAGVASATVNPPRAPTSTAILSAQSVSYTWNTSTAGGTENVWVVRSSLNGTATPVTAAVLSPTSTVLTYTFTGLATNTLYTFDVAGSDGVASSTLVTSSPVYTAAATPSAPTLSSTGPQNLLITMATDTNPASRTIYIVKDTNASVGLKYLQVGGTWGAATTTFNWWQLGGGAATTTIGLATNTQHTISIAAVNSDSSATSSYSSTVSLYTAAVAPSIPTLSSIGAQTLRITMATDTNPAANTTYVVKDTNASVGLKYLQADATWGAATATLSWFQLGGGAATTTVGLATSTSHTVSVAAVNGDSSNTTTYTSAGTLSTLAATPAAPTTVTSTAATTLTITIDTSTINSNPTTTASFIVRDTASGTLYLKLNGTWGATTTTLTWAQLGSGSATTTTGLTPNTQHIIDVAAVNNDNTATTTYGATTTSYTLASVPSALTFTNDNQARTITVSWTGDGTNYYVQNVTNNTNSGLIATKSYISTGLGCNGTYGFRIYSTNVSGASSAFSATTTDTLTCIAAGGSGGGSTPPPNPPSVTSTQAATSTGATVVTPPGSGQTPAIVTLPPEANAVAVSRQQSKVNRFKFNAALKLGSSGANVEQLQTLLKELGFFTPPKTTKFFGSVTKAALIAYQKANNLSATGLLDASTRSALQNESENQVEAPTATAPSNVQFKNILKLGSVGDEVKQLQEKLKELGFFNFPTATGYFGTATREAVIKFQKAKGLAPFPGLVGPGTRAALNSL